MKQIFLFFAILPYLKSLVPNSCLTYSTKKVTGHTAPPAHQQALFACLPSDCAAQTGNSSRSAMALAEQLTTVAARVFWIFTIILCESWSRSTQTCKYMCFSILCRKIRVVAWLFTEEISICLDGSTSCYTFAIQDYNKWNQQMNSSLT